MSKACGLLRGSKVSSRHSTYTPFAAPVIKALKEINEVKKVILGPISRCKAGPRRLKVSEDHGQVRIQVRDSHAVQILYAVGAPISEVESRLKALVEDMK